MAKAQDSRALNNLLRNEVRNYNKRVKRAEQRGFRNLPSLEKVSEIKSRYKSRSDIMAQIERLRRFNTSKGLTRTANSAGTKVFNWQKDFIQSNLAGAKEYFKSEYARVAKRELRFPGERTYLDAISSKLRLLEQDFASLTQSQARSMYATIKEFYDVPKNREAQYRGFLSEVEWVMEITGISQEQRDKFFKKFNTLTPSQFLYAYDNNDIIERVYNLYVRQGENEPYLSDNLESATKIIELLMDEVDDIVNDAKANMD